MDSQPQADSSVVDQFIEKYASDNRDGPSNYRTSESFEPIDAKRALNAALHEAIEELHGIGDSTVETVVQDDNGYIRKETHEVGLYPSDTRRMQAIMTDITAMVKMGAKPQAAEYGENDSPIDSYPKSAPRGKSGNTIPETKVQQEIREFLNQTLAHPFAALTNGVELSGNFAASKHSAGEAFTGSTVADVRNTTNVEIV